MGIFTDYTGKTFNSWTVIKREKNRYGYKTYWLCRCDCGRQKEVSGSSLVNGTSKQCSSCSCKASKTKHGHCADRKKPPEYNIWNSMKQRCSNKNIPEYKNYGGRGITVCERWRTDFTKFVEDIGPQPFKRASIDRINNNGNYEPGNVVWTTQYQQTGNTRKQKHGICVKRWSKDNNLDRFHVAKMLKDGKTLEEIKISGCPKFRDYEKGHETFRYKWAKKHEFCANCGTTEIKHFGHGMCQKCYRRKYYTKKKGSLTPESEDGYPAFRSELNL
jgi:hypothetical protein